VTTPGHQDRLQGGSQAAKQWNLVALSVSEATELSANRYRQTLLEPASSPQSENCSVFYASLCSFDAITDIHTNRPILDL
jgi:hypothetical protein